MLRQSLVFTKLINMCAMLQSRLIGIMQRELESQNLQLSIYCTQQIEQMVSNGVQRMRTSKVIDHSGHIMQAERNLRALVNYLGEFSKSAGTYPSLTNSSFDAAMSNCPNFWPYCSSG